VLISRINSLESWFIFNLQKNKQISCGPIHISHILLTYNLKAISWIYHITFIHMYLSSYRLQHLVNGSISVSFWGKTDSLSMHWGHVAPLVQLALVSAINKLFVPTVQISHVQSPYNGYTSLNTFIQVNILGVRHDMQTHTYVHTHNLQLFFLFFYLTSRQVCWPRTLM
jgi:hypothetical protein